ncbi:MAG: hypothetical protein ACTHLW_21030 [Verrucomicrobiota bacterium]
MSHIATIATTITDLNAVKLACAELGLTFNENQTTCMFWPDAGQPQLQPCDHAIQLPSGSYKMELGLVRNPDGSYALVGDDLLHQSEADGPTGEYWVKAIFGMDKNPLGRKFQKLIQLYGVHKTTLEAKKKGWLVNRSYVPGTQKIQLTVTGM